MAAHARELTDIEFAKSIMAAGSLRNQLIIQLTHWSGMRIGEVAQLNVSDVVANDGTIKDLIRLTPKQTKRNWGRDVMLSSKMRLVLADFLQSISNYDIKAPLIVSERTGKRMATQSLINKCRSIYCDAGIVGASSHSGRRTCISKMILNGTPLPVVMAAHGHRQMATTQRYATAPTNMIRAAIEQL